MTDIIADWPAPKHISTITTSRLHGFSRAPYDSNNLAMHVEDDTLDVEKNRQSLASRYSLPGIPAWLNQTHSTTCVLVEKDENRNADASITRSPSNPLAILTADCLPIALCNQKGDEIGLIHAGWRGLAHGIIDNTLAQMDSDPQELMAWIGPSICSNCFETGDDVYKTFKEEYSFTLDAFRVHGNKWLANLQLIAEKILKNAGVSHVFHSGICSMENTDTCYSFRASPKTGRMATLIWFNNSTGR